MTDELWMQRCLELAQNGLGRTSPNPLVGSVVVHNGKIFGEGWHQKAGSPHAEVNAITAVQNPELLPESTLYVNLEPCAHFGKTPPCANLIVEKKLKRVVIANRDPHEKVSGKGIEILRQAGIEVVEGVLEAEGAWLNRRFFTYHQKQRPYIILKWAQSNDGFMDVERATGQMGSVPISHPHTKTLVHRWRSEEDAILVGANTALVDDPILDTRAFSGKNPIPVILDPEGKITHPLRCFNHPQTIHFSPKSLTGHSMPQNANSLKSLMELLHCKGILSLFVEGGAYTHQRFLQHLYWDEMRVITSKAILGKGLKAPDKQGRPVSVFPFGEDEVAILKNIH